MTLYWLFFGPLFVVCMMAFLISAVTDNRPLARVATVLALNWATNTAFCLATGIYDPWLFFFIVDAISARIVLWPPAGRVQSLIGWTYIGQCLIHLVYGIAARPGAEQLYWRVLTDIGFAQLLLLGVWAGGYGGYRLWRLCRSRWALRAGRQGVA